MEDRELLELAAKAAGIRSPAGVTSENGIVDADSVGWGLWNPLNNDSDALRLAVKLGLEVYAPTQDDPQAYAVSGIDADRAWGIANVAGDPCATTRRAIVRAAAAMGKQYNAALSCAGNKPAEVPGDDPGVRSNA